MAKDVNRRLGLTDDSTVGKTVAASASAGLKIPLTDIGAAARTEGKHVDQQSLKSAYDYARTAVENALITNAAGLVREFRLSDAYQWAKGSRTTSTDGFDMSSRESVDHQASTEVAYAKAKELARTAQFMREWGSGTQTDFTNYAARRLAERGILKEEDPVALQKAVTEIAMAYARGGEAPGGFAGANSPIGPAPHPPRWREGSMEPSYRDAVARQSGEGIVGEETIANRDQVQRHQAAAGTEPSSRTSDDVGGRLRADRTAVAQNLDQGKTRVQGTGDELSADYRRSVRIGKVSEEHGGNSAVWSTIGINASQPDLGEPAKANVPAQDEKPPQKGASGEQKKHSPEDGAMSEKRAPKTRGGASGTW